MEFGELEGEEEKKINELKKKKERKKVQEREGEGTKKTIMIAM